MRKHPCYTCGGTGIVAIQHPTHTTTKDCVACNGTGENPVHAELRRRREAAR